MCVDPKMNGFEAELRSLYTRLGFIDETGGCRPLHESCACRAACWKGSEGRTPGDSPLSHVSRPWVGQKYKDLQLLAVGINQNECGGYGALIELVVDSCAGIRNGQRRIFGKVFYHRLGTYAAAFAEARKCMSPSWGTDDSLPSAEVADAFDFIAYTNYVKCSPKGERSRPTTAMWERCGKHVLREEISVLKPRHVLVLGRSANAPYFDSKVLDQPCLDWKHSGSVMTGQGTVLGARVRTFVVPHPMSTRHKAGAVVSALRSAIEDRHQWFI